MRDDIDVMGEVLKLVKVRIFVEGRTYDECDKRVKSVLDRLDAAGYEASIFLNEEINDFRSVYLPYTKQQELEEAKVYARYGQPLESITLADGIPFHFTNLVDPTGTYLGSTSLGGTVLFDMHTQNNVRTAYNGVVLGKQGAGKSKYPICNSSAVTSLVQVIILTVRAHCFEPVPISCIFGRRHPKPIYRFISNKATLLNSIAKDASKDQLSFACAIRCADNTINAHVGHQITDNIALLYSFWRCNIFKFIWDDW